MKVCIVGGGISGLALALHLGEMRAEGADIETVLLEKENRYGGTIDTAYENGYAEEAGPNGYLDSKPWMGDLFKKAGLTDNLLRSNDLARKRYIMRGGELVRLPETPPAFFASKLVSWGGKFRLMGELLVPQKKDDSDESIADFATRRLGREALDYLIGPMVSGVFAGDPTKMSLQSCFPVIANLEKQYGGLFKAMIKKARENKKKGAGPAGPGGVLTSYKGGLRKGINDLAARIRNVDMRQGTTVTAVTKADGQYRVETDNGVFTCDQLVLCCPAYESARFLRPLSEPLSRELDSLSYPPVMVVGMGFDASQVRDPLDGFGYLIPAKENRQILGALFSSSIFPERAPEGKRLLRVILGGDRMRPLMEKSTEELVEIALKDAGDTLGFSGRPEMIKTFRWDKAIPQYYIGHSKLIERVEAMTAELGGLYVGSNVLYGIGLGECTRTSQEIADKIASQL